MTFLFTDIERSTDHARRLGSEFGALRSEHRRVLRQAFADHGGVEIDTAGDGFFVVFQRAADAVNAAAAGQRALDETESTREARLRVRMGLHTAEPFLDDEGYVGVGVHRAARICAIAHGGQTLMSNATAGIVEDLGLHGVRFHEVGEHRLKDMERPQRLFQLDVEGLASEFPPLQDRSHYFGTLLATDLAGWSNVLRGLGDEAALMAALRYQAMVSEAAEAHGGRAVEAVGDFALALFERPGDAVRAAVVVRKALEEKPWIPDEHRCPLRCGVHSGRLVSLQGGHLGSVAAHTARLCELAEPGEILVSTATEALLEGEVPEFGLRDLGERTLAGRDRPERVFAVSD
ncbi:MAG TPA: adenylate/guanylate cyclase domain-containing protein [Gaiellaceae bacterium]|nr:adenylate/guanylate cyclase domain-containing protein [Gaiellaceae bacterium]